MFIYLFNSNNLQNKMLKPNTRNTEQTFFILLFIQTIIKLI